MKLPFNVKEMMKFASVISSSQTLIKIKFRKHFFTSIEERGENKGSRNYKPTRETTKNTISKHGKLNSPKLFDAPPELITNSDFDEL